MAIKQLYRVTDIKNKNLNNSIVGGVLYYGTQPAAYTEKEAKIKASKYGGKIEPIPVNKVIDYQTFGRSISLSQEKRKVIESFQEELLREIYRIVKNSGGVIFKNTEFSNQLFWDMENIQIKFISTDLDIVTHAGGSRRVKDMTIEDLLRLCHMLEVIECSQ